MTVSSAKKAIVDSQVLAKNPRSVTLINVNTGTTVVVKDDGASLTANDGTFPNQKRQVLLCMAKEEFKRGGRSSPTPAFRAWVTESKLEKSSGDPSKDPAQFLKCLSDIDEKSGLSYRALIEKNVADNKLLKKKELDQDLADFKRLGAKPEVIARFQSLVDAAKEESAPVAPVEVGEEDIPSDSKGKKK